MNIADFMFYLYTNYTISGEAHRLIANILHYAKTLPKEERHPFVIKMLEGTIGISEDEIRKIEL